jgi:outer membrane immunogenic protein
MRRSTLKSAALLALAAAIAPASAADVPVPVLKAPPAPVVIDPWTGFYAGAHAGYGWGQKRFIDNFPTFDGEVDADTQAKGGLGGLQAGYNYQVRWLVLGVEADFSWSGVNNKNFPCFLFGDQVCSAEPEWFATLAGRIGIANGPALIYLKGGAAVVHDTYTNLATCAGSQPTSRDGISAACGTPFFANQNRFGWLVGAGIERFIAPNWSLKLEYNHMEFGGRSVLFEDGGGDFFTEEIHQKVHLIKAGINYYFDWGPAAASPAGVRGHRSVAASDTVNESFKRVAAFSGADVSKYSTSGWMGALIAPVGDLDTSGPRFFIIGEGGRYKYPAGSGFIRGVSTSGDVLAGYGFEGDNYSVNLLAGANAANHMLSAIDPTNSVQGTAFGAKARADAWLNPTPQSLIHGEAEYSTAFRTYYAAAKLGYDITQNQRIFAGPEVAALGNRRFDQWRVGAHLTQLKIGKIQADVSGGYAHDSVVGDGAYGNVEVSTAF